MATSSNWFDLGSVPTPKGLGTPLDNSSFLPGITKAPASPTGEIPSDYESFYGAAPEQKVKWLSQIGSGLGMTAKGPNKAWNNAIAGFMNPVYRENPKSQAFLKQLYTELYQGYTKYGKPELGGNPNALIANAPHNFESYFEELAKSYLPLVKAVEPSNLGLAVMDPKGFVKHEWNLVEPFIPTPKGVVGGLNAPAAYAEQGDIGRALASLLTIVLPSVLHDPENPIAAENADREIPLTRADASHSVLLRTLQSRLSSFDSTTDSLRQTYDRAIQKASGPVYKDINNPAFKVKQNMLAALDQIKDPAPFSSNHLASEKLVQQLGEAVKRVRTKYGAKEDELWTDARTTAKNHPEPLGEPKETAIPTAVNRATPTLDSKVVKRTVKLLAKTKTSSDYVDTLRIINHGARLPGEQGAYFNAIKGALTQDAEAKLPDDVKASLAKANKFTRQRVTDFNSPHVRQLMANIKKPGFAIDIARSLMTKDSPLATQGLLKILRKDPEGLAALKSGFKTYYNDSHDSPLALAKEVENNSDKMRMVMGNKDYTELLNKLYDKANYVPDPFLNAIKSRNGGLDISSGSQLASVVKDLPYNSHLALRVAKAIQDHPELEPKAVQHILYNVFDDSIYGKGYFGDGRSILNPAKLGENLEKAIPSLKVFMEKNDPKGVDHFASLSRELSQAKGVSAILDPERGANEMQIQNIGSHMFFPKYAITRALGTFGGLKALMRYASSLDGESSLDHLIRAGDQAMHFGFGAYLANTAADKKKSEQGNSGPLAQTAQ